MSVRRYVGRLTVLLLALALLLSVVPLTAFASEKEIYYGRSQLAAMAQGSRLVGANKKLWKQR